MTPFPHKRVSTASARGAAHATNQDAFLAHRRRGLQVLAVADGVSGGASGGLAARVALRTFGDELRRRTDAGSSLLEAAEGAMRGAAEAVQEAGGGDGSRRWTMATTLTAVCICGREGVLAHAGDSRAYLWRGGALAVLTEDHSVAEELVRAGALSPAHAGQHHARHVLTQAVGVPGLRPQVKPFSVEPGDVLLLCTDGVHTAVSEETLAGFLAGSGIEAADRAVASAVAAGTRDDATAAAVRIPTHEPVQPWRWTTAVAGLAVVAALLLAAFWNSRFLGISNEHVALFRGFRLEVAGIPLHRIERVYATTAGDLAPLYRDLLMRGLPVHDEGDALRILRQIPRRSP